jgi:hypothetical protein
MHGGRLSLATSGFLQNDASAYLGAHGSCSQRKASRAVLVAA